MLAILAASQHGHHHGGEHQLTAHEEPHREQMQPADQVPREHGAGSYSRG
jgi:hypothetical protein